MAEDLMRWIKPELSYEERRQKGMELLVVAQKKAKLNNVFAILAAGMVGLFWYSPLHAHNLICTVCDFYLLNLFH